MAKITTILLIIIIGLILLAGIAFFFSNQAKITGGVTFVSDQVPADRYVNPSDQRTLLIPSTDGGSTTSTINVDFNTVSWDIITNFPTGCPANFAVQTIGTTLTCISIPTSTGNDDDNAYLDQSKFDSNMNLVRIQNQSLSGKIDVNQRNSFNSQDVNVVHDVNVGGQMNFIFALGNGIITHGIFGFGFNKDILPSLNNVFNLGSATNIWNTLFAGIWNCQGKCVINTQSSTDKNVVIYNSGSGNANLDVNDGNGYFKNNVYIDHNLFDANATINDKLRVMGKNGLYLDSNGSKKDENVFIINDLVMIGEANTAESGDQLATAMSNIIGVKYTCLFTTSLAGAINNCSSSLVNRNVWAKITGG